MSKILSLTLLIFTIGSCSSHGLSETEPKILFFVTTHMSDSHISFLKNTWPYILKRFDIFSSADFLLYTTNTPEWIGDIFPERLKIRTYQNPGYQEGANLAMKEFVEKEWYKGYDWIIRLNPDVIIKDDTWLIEKMGDTSVDGIFIDCLDTGCETSHCERNLIHTDFFAVRSSVFSAGMFKNIHMNAEKSATREFSKTVKDGRDSWLPNNGPHKGNCRVRGANSPVIHQHQYTDAKTIFNLDVNQHNDL